MRIKSLLVTAVLATAVLCFGPSVGAQGVDVQAQIQALLQQIAALQAQLQVLQGQQQGTTPWCHTFNKNLRIGDSGPEIDMLATALSKEGLFSTARAYPDFDEYIASAVVQFQEKYTSEILAPYNLKRGTGYAGPSTRKKLNALYGCSSAQIPCLNGQGPLSPGQSYCLAQPSITVTSPNGGETYKNDGSSITVNWQTINVPLLQKLDVIRLRAYPNGQEYNLAYNVLNDGREVIVIPSSVPVGAYTLEIKTYVAGVLVFDASDSYFKIVSVATIQPMIIKDIRSITSVNPSTVANLSFGVGEVSAQNNLGAYHQGTWLEGQNPGVAGPVWVEFQWDRPQTDVVFVDDNGTQRKIYLPAGNICAYSSATPGTCSPNYYWIAQDGSSYYATKNHSYGWPDISSAEALRPEHLARVAGSVPAQPSITVTSPASSGASWAAGSTHNITWTASGVNNVNITLYRYGTTNLTIASNIPASNGSYAWAIPNTYTPVTGYYIKVTESGGTTVGQSPLTITPYVATVISPSPTPPPAYSSAPQISILANPSSVFSGGSTQISWTAVGADNCRRAGDWGAVENVGVSGTYQTEALTRTASYFTITCVNSVGTNTKSVEVRAIDSTSPFVIITSPNGGESWKKRTTHTITWRLSDNWVSSGLGSTKILIKLYKNDPKWSLDLAPSGVLSSAGSFSWTVPTNNAYIVDGSDYQIKISSLANDSIYDISDDYFGITTSLFSGVLGSSAEQNSLASISGVLQTIADQIRQMLGQ